MIVESVVSKLCTHRFMISVQVIPVRSEFFLLSKFCRTILFKMLHRSRHALGGYLVANPRSFG